MEIKPMKTLNEITRTADPDTRARIKKIKQVLGKKNTTFYLNFWKIGDGVKPTERLMKSE